MNTQPALKFRDTLQEVQRRFSFLFRRGFRIVSAMFVDMNNEQLQVILISHDCIVNICCDGSQMELGLSTHDLYDTVGFLDISQLITLIQGKNQFGAAQSFQGTVQLMENHMDEILLKLIQIQRCVKANENGQLLQGNCPFFYQPDELFPDFTIDHITVI